MTNGPWLVSMLTRKISGAVSVSRDGSFSASCARTASGVNSPTAASTSSDRQQSIWALFSGAAGELARFGVHLDALAFLDEQRHADLEAGLGARNLGHAAAGRIAARAELGLGNRHFDERRQLQADRIAVELVDLHEQIVDEQPAVLSD